MRARAYIVAISIATSVGAPAPAVGSPLPRWTPGTLDIHQISTGRGNSALVVRVEPGGARYWVFVLSNNDGRDTIVAVKGPFTSGT
jgi:hypothetical protein